MDIIRDNLQVIRRFTGGGTVIVDADTVFASLILNVRKLECYAKYSLTINRLKQIKSQSADIGCPPYPREIMKWTEQEVYGPVFEDLTASANTAGTGSDAKFSLLENDYVWGDRKVRHTGAIIP